MNERNSYKAIKIENDLWTIEENGVRCFFVLGNSRALLIDTGFGSGNILSFVKNLTDLPIFLVTTHADPDHIGGLDLFESTYLHPSEYENLKRRYDIDKIKILPLWEGDIIDLGTYALEVILLPGHTPGSIALLDRQKRVLFGGDSIMPGPIYMFGQGRNMKAYICSMEKVLKISDRFDCIYASHGQLEIQPDIIPYLIEGAKKLLAGEISGIKPENGLPCLLYYCERVKFFY